jgi:DNA-binding CsgD family transcriptional regulator
MAWLRPKRTTFGEGVLSPRERDVIELIAVGGTYQEVADALSISIHTVHYHVTRLIYRLGAKNCTHAVALWTRARVTEELRAVPAPFMKVDVPPMSKASPDEW